VVNHHGRDARATVKPSSFLVDVIAEPSIARLFVGSEMPVKQLALFVLVGVLMISSAPLRSARGQASDTAPAATLPATSAANPSTRINDAGEKIITFESATAGKAIPSWTDGPVTFTLASAPQRSRAQGRIMFFPHLKTDRRGILNAMANEQAIPVKAEISGGASSVTLVLWGTIGCKAWVEAHDKDGKLLNRAELPDTVPQRKSPSEPVPSFELTVKADNIAYILFGGAINGGALVADEMRYLPAGQTASGQDKK